MEFKFSVYGLVIFLLPMFINVVYFLLPPKNIEGEDSNQNKILESIEQISRIAFAVAICTLVSMRELDFKSPFLYLALLFLVLYYIVWIRYFTKGRDVSLLGENFLFVPIPLAVFPVMYFIFASIWMNNYIALAIMILFGIVHFKISYENLYINKNNLE